MDNFLISIKNKGFLIGGVWITWVVDVGKYIDNSIKLSGNSLSGTPSLQSAKEGTPNKLSVAFVLLRGCG